MTSNDAVRVVVRETDLRNFYASSPDVRGLNAYARSEDELVVEVALALQEIWKATRGVDVIAKPVSGGPRQDHWSWRLDRLDPLDARACA